ncbi:hypothetical protein [Catellatospora sp. IY07-71]|uniref:hypothetical protein n=1 Tax=Catellatospora sp. IY07-71 TaxID=2728827 RepID=UPI001BB428A9|nr:hypothetical protein [Catellatospora sp. IY07-71]
MYFTVGLLVSGGTVVRRSHQVVTAAAPFSTRLAEKYRGISSRPSRTVVDQH